MVALMAPRTLAELVRALASDPRNYVEKMVSHVVSYYIVEYYAPSSLGTSCKYLHELADGCLKVLKLAATSTDGFAKYTAYSLADDLPEELELVRVQVQLGQLPK